MQPGNLGRNLTIDEGVPERRNERNRDRGEHHEWRGTSESAVVEAN